jgi:hypothetical protein
LLDEVNKLAVIIENKIGSEEHSGQLRRYRETVLKEYPGWNTVGLYITPEGEMPTDDNYIPIDYGLISELLNDLVETQFSVLGADVRTLMIHYT